MSVISVVKLLKGTGEKRSLPSETRGWLANSPQLLKGNRVKSDVLKPADADTDSQL